MYEISGIVMVDISVEHLSDLMQTSPLTDRSSISLLDQNGAVIIGESEISRQLADEIKKHSSNPQDTIHIYSIGDSLAGTSSDIMDGWQVLSITPLSDFNKANIDLRQNAILLIIAISIVAVFVVNRVSKYYSRRIGALADTMGEVEKGDLSVNILVDSGDEIGILQNSFNFMVRRLKTLLDETYVLGQELRGVELEVLQEQINPHFLYNTLDMIYWMAKDKNDPEIANIILKLAHFYRLSLQQGKETVTLHEEIEQARLFIELINLRNKKHIDLIIDTDDCIRNYMILKLTIQPLIENSIVHGIMPSARNQSQITIRARRDAERIRLEICDDGIGMTAVQLRSLRHFIDTPTAFAEEGGFGLRNTINRLRMSFGDAFDFEIESAPDQGSKVTLWLPVDSFAQNNDS